MAHALMEPEEYIRRIRLCLFEVGYHDIRMEQRGLSDNGLPLVATYNTVPASLAYMAARLAVMKDFPALRHCCYGCFQLSFHAQDQGAAVECRKGNCVSGGPAWPSHEELLGADRTEGLEIHADVA